MQFLAHFRFLPEILVARHIVCKMKYKIRRLFIYSFLCVALSLVGGGRDTHVGRYPQFSLYYLYLSLPLLLKTSLIQMVIWQLNFLASPGHSFCPSTAAAESFIIIIYSNPPPLLRLLLLPSETTKTPPTRPRRRDVRYEIKYCSRCVEWNRVVWGWMVYLPCHESCCEESQSKVSLMDTSHPATGGYSSSLFTLALSLAGSI